MVGNSQQSLSKSTSNSSLESNRTASNSNNNISASTSSSSIHRPQPQPQPPPSSSSLLVSTSKRDKGKQNQSSVGEDEDSIEADPLPITDGVGNGSENPRAKKRKRNRVVLSCTNCKARKIKCDRQIPGCSSCQRRGLSHTCRWGDERDDAFLGAERSNETLMTRIRELESMVTALTNRNESFQMLNNQLLKGPSWSASTSTSEIRNGNEAPLFTSSEKSRKDETTRSDARSPRVESNQVSDEESNESDTEDAAQVLEAMASGIPNFNQERRTTLPSLRHGSHETNQENSRVVESPSRNGNLSSNFTPGGKPPIINRKNHPKFSLPSLPGLSNFSVVPAPPTMSVNSQDSQIEQCLRSLPKMKDLKNIALWYLEEIDPILKCLNSVIFKQQLSEFEIAFNARMTTSTSSPMSIDLSFLALLFAVLSASAEYRTSSELVEFGFSPNEESMDLVLENFYCSSIALLGLSDFGERPTMNGLSSIVALSHYAFARRKQQSYGALIVMSLRLAENLGIHRLGSALDDAERWKRETSSQNSSNDDHLVPEGLGSRSSKTRRLSSTSKDSHSSGSFAGSPNSKGLGHGKDREKQPLHGMFLPPGLVQIRESETQYADYSHSKRELARSVWLALCTLETFTSSHVGSSTYLASNNGITTNFPLNLEDEEISNSEAGDFSIRPHPPDFPTSKRFVPLLYQVGIVARMIVDSMIAGEGYSAISEIDSKMMLIKSKLPDFFVYDGKIEHSEEMKEMHRKSPYLTFQRILINEWIFHRLLQCHRIYMTRGYRSPKYKASLDRSIECAQGVIQMRREMDVYMKAAPDRQARANYGLLTVHLFQAASALQMYLLHQVNARENVSYHLLKDIEDAVSYLENHPSGQTRQAMAQNAIDVLQKLKSEMHSRISSSVKSPAKHDHGEPKTQNNSHQSNSSHHADETNPSTPITIQRDQNKTNHQTRSRLEHVRSSTISNLLSSRSWETISEDQAVVLHPPETKTSELESRPNPHVRASTWQSSGSTPLYQAQDQEQILSHPSNSRSSYSPHLQQQYHSSRLQNSLPSYPPSNPTSNHFDHRVSNANSGGAAEDSAQLPFDLDAYLETVSVTIPGERGDRVFQTLDGLLTNGSGSGSGSGPSSNANSASGGMGISSTGLSSTYQAGRNHLHSSSSTQQNSFAISAAQNIHPFPIPPQAPTPIPQTMHFGYGITTMPHGSADPNPNPNHHLLLNLSKNNGPSYDLSPPSWGERSSNLNSYHPSPPSHHSSASNSPHLNQNQNHQKLQQLHYQAQQRSKTSVGGGVGNDFRTSDNLGHLQNHSQMSNQNQDLYMNNR